ELAVVARDVGKPQHNIAGFAAAHQQARLQEGDWIAGNTTVGALVAQNDGYRVYVDAYLRGARVVSVTPMAEGNYETEVEIEMPADFAQRVATTAAKSSEGAARSMAYNSFYYAD
ncbi:MAG: hypothetical protein ACRCZ5_00685, partial [Burkholderiales bacterium]